MGAAKKAADQAQSITEKAATFLEPHREKYVNALDLATAAEATTSTPGWKANYEAQQRRHWAAITEACKSAESALTAIRRDGPNEDLEKIVKDAAKSLGEEREQFAAWIDRQVSSYRRAAEDCCRVIDAASRAIDEAERNQPLLYRGVADEVRRVVRGWPRPSWDAKAGTVTVNH